MKAESCRADPSRESLTPENCFILERANDPSDPDVSIARARVLPGVTTEWHRIDVDERWACIGRQQLAMQRIAHLHRFAFAYTANDKFTKSGKTISEDELK